MTSSSLPAPECVFFDNVGELDVVVERVQHMQAAVTAARDLLAPRLHGAAHALLIPVREREADVIDDGARCRAIAWRCIAGDDEGATLAGRRAEHQVRALAGVLAGRVLEPEYVDIEVARLGVVR